MNGEPGTILRTIPKNAPYSFAIREDARWYRRADVRSIVYSWWCRGCFESNRLEVYQTEPLLQITCAHCKLTVQRSCPEDDWHCWIPERKPDEKENRTSDK